jgi:methionine-S-sulfoxide reductase
MSTKNSEIVVAGGCFWGVEELIRKVPGVIETEVGYTGGTLPNPTYEQVKTGATGHAEAVRIVFDQNKISLEKVLELFFNLHDPTTLNRQGQDVGSQYRSAIFVRTAQERAIAEQAIAKENASGRWSRLVLTTIEPLTAFHSAERYHQDYLQRNPNGYNCHYWRRPDPSSRS